MEVSARLIRPTDVLYRAEAKQAVENPRESVQKQASGLHAAWVSDVGAVRHSNQDRCLAAPERGLFIISDGMGGEHAGNRASELVVESLPELLERHLGAGGGLSPQEVERALKDATLELNQLVKQASSRLKGPRKMGATLAMALARGDRLHVAHMGDSRGYLFGEGGLRCLTRDHSVVAILVRRGAISPEQARSHPMRGRLSRYVGVGGETAADVTSLRWQRGDRLLLCTDGLTDVVEDEEIARTLAENPDPLAACNALADAGRRPAGRDNVTVLLVEKSE